ncbi:MAG TPA: acyl-CoA dehydratase activase, partial [Smithella sp.]|nr:acyl-CoA dehydratase activase [Smithella sp.]
MNICINHHNQQNRKLKYLGICVGSSTLTMVTISSNIGEKISITDIFQESHHGNPRNALEQAIRNINPSDYENIAITGQKLRHLVNITSIPEPKAIEHAFKYVNGNKKGIQTIVSAGSETFMLYRLDRKGHIVSVNAGNKCASGTGEFFLQQINRMGIELDEAVQKAKDVDPYPVSGRCSVFCKSDCTHATNKGIPKERVAAGLCRMMAGKILELLKKDSHGCIMIIGGCTKNTVMVDYLKSELHSVTVPVEASYFEALGCALWAMENDAVPISVKSLFRSQKNTFSSLPPLKNAESMVTYKTAARGIPRAGDICILGLDVGSTTTKAVLIRTTDNLILATDYLRTNGDPVRAARACYSSLLRQLGDNADKISIISLGVTGSGRQIAGLHAMTDGIINEITAHATGAIYFDESVDTIFEIGGQDAKYTYITNGVPCDYAMNEACSAGTGSFLEEAAKETLNIKMEEIADIALQGTCPPNFNDQCAAFISSDIKTAFHEGISVKDIVAGLVYSVCMNYNNRVKGNRPVGQKIFMQGGVCYNRAVPLAMAALTGKSIVVPPEPGLIGAFGVALEVKHRIELGLMKKGVYSLKTLRDREIEYGPSFVCGGGKEKCDRHCEIAKIKIGTKTYPFGGACNLWYNLRSNIETSAGQFNDVSRYEHFIFRDNPVHEAVNESGLRTIGINKSFLVNTYYPLYKTFFEEIGFRVILSSLIEQEGIDQKSAPFCYPAEIAHGYFLNLLQKKPDYLFLPQLKCDYVEHGDSQGVCCPLSQGEPYYLAAAFKDHGIYEQIKASGRILNPVIDFSRGISKTADVFVDMALQLGVSKKNARKAFLKAVNVQQDIFNEIKDFGLQALADIENDPNAFGIVVFGRSYNALVSEAHKGIPNKIASRGIHVIPMNSLPLAEKVTKENMYWSAGQRILQAAAFVAKHPKLYGCYITNFSCGPDSFLIGYFRNMMGKKPSLTLELDSHVADAGLETRIEAFIEIIKSYRQQGNEVQSEFIADQFSPAKVRTNKDQATYIDSAGAKYSIPDPSVHLIIPSMGRFLSEAAAATFRGIGIRATALPPADDKTLKLGRTCSTCKECLPLIITTGSLLKYLDERSERNEKLIYFMPTASGPCRYGQYSVFINDLIQKRRIKDVSLLSFSAENSYTGFGGNRLSMAIWSGAIIASLFEEIYSILLTNAISKYTAMKIFEKQWEVVLLALEKFPDLTTLSDLLRRVADVLKEIPVKRNLADTPVILLAGEIFVRHDDISRQFLLEELAKRGFATKVASLLEWIYYTDWCVQNGVSADHVSVKDRLALLFRNKIMRQYEKVLRKALLPSNLCWDKMEDVNHVMKNTIHLINPMLAGEAILTVGTVLSDIVDHYCGAIAIGPFGCMPNRIAEAILTREMNMDGKRNMGKNGHQQLLHEQLIQEFPFMAIESDGNPFPSIIMAKLEAFMLQAERLHEEIRNSNVSKY